MSKESSSLVERLVRELSEFDTPEPKKQQGSGMASGERKEPLKFSSH